MLFRSQAEYAYHAHRCGQTQALVQRVESYYDSGHDLSGFARDVSRICFEDGGKWLVNILERDNAFGAGKLFYLFVSFPLFDAFGPSQQGADMLLDIMEKTVKRLEEIANHTPRSDTYEAYGISCGRFGQLLESLGRYDGALVLYKSDIEAYEELVSILDTPSVKRELIVGYTKAGGIHYRRNRLDMAVDLYSKALALAEELTSSGQFDCSADLSALYSRMADALVQMSQHDRALKLYQKSQFITRGLLKNSNDATLHAGFASNYVHIGEIYEHAHLYSKALSCMEKAGDIYARLARQKNDASHLLDLAAVFDRTGKIHFTVVNFAQAAEQFEQVVELSRRLVLQL